MTKPTQLLASPTDPAGRTRPPQRTRDETTPRRALPPLLLLLSLIPAAAQAQPQQVVFDVRMVRRSPRPATPSPANVSQAGPRTRGAQQSSDFNLAQALQLYFEESAADGAAPSPATKSSALDDRIMPGVEIGTIGCYRARLLCCDQNGWRTDASQQGSVK